MPYLDQLDIAEIVCIACKSLKKKRKNIEYCCEVLCLVDISMAKFFSSNV